MFVSLLRSRSLDVSANAGLHKPVYSAPQNVNDIGPFTRDTDDDNDQNPQVLNMESLNMESVVMQKFLLLQLMEKSPFLHTSIM
jgi:hypothetical protein